MNKRKKKKLFRGMPPRMYCGNKDPLPPGYQGYDTRLNCLRKGVGIGLYRIPNANGPRMATNTTSAAPTFATMPTNRKTWWLGTPWWVWVLLVLSLVVLIVLLVLLFRKS